MPVVGTKPKPDGQRRRRNAPTFEWAEVENVPYTGEVPFKLGSWALPETQRWWAVVSSMPHCVLWTPADWEYAWATAVIRNLFADDPLKASKELREREKMLGLTLDQRRDLRIRYVEPQIETPDGVASIADYRAIAASDEPAEGAS